MKLADRLRNINLFYILLGVYVLWLLSLKNRHTGGMDDFDVFFKAGERLANGENIYGEPHYYNLRYFYSVFFACLMALCQWMHIDTAKLLWFTLNTALYIRAFFILRQYVLSVSPHSNLVFFLTLLLTGKIVLVNYTFGQASPLVLWTMTEAFHQVLQGRTTLGVLILCLGINIKIMPLVLAPYIVWASKKPVTAIIAGISFTLAFLFLPALFIGWDYNLMLLGEWWQTLNPVSDIHVRQTYENGFMDLAAMVNKYLSAESVYNEPQLNIASLPMSTLFILTNMIRVALLGSVVYMAAKLKRPVAGIDHRFIIASGFMALIPLCFPHQRVYSYMFSIPSLAVMLAILFNNRRALSYVLFAVLILVSGVMIWIDFAGQVIADFFTHYRMLTLGMTGLLVMYIVLCIRQQNEYNATDLLSVNP